MLERSSSPDKTKRKGPNVTVLVKGDLHTCFFSYKKNIGFFFFNVLWYFDKLINKSFIFSTSAVISSTSHEIPS
jgi:hypothetical protein